MPEELQIIEKTTRLMSEGEQPIDGGYGELAHQKLKINTKANIKQTKKQNKMKQQTDTKAKTNIIQNNRNKTKQQTDSKQNKK